VSWFALAALFPEQFDWVFALFSVVAVVAVVNHV
jgi:hypothetical protein